MSHLFQNNKNKNLGTGVHQNSSASSSFNDEGVMKNDENITSNLAADYQLSDAEVTIHTVMPSFDGKKWFQLKHIQKLCFVIFVISLTACNTGYDGSLLNSLYTMPDFNNAIGNVNGSILGALTNGYVFGCLLSFFVTAKINDALGRKKALIIGNVIMLAGVLVQSFSGAWIHGLPENYTKRDILGMMIGGRIILGFGSGILQVAAPSLISELSFPTHRQATTTVYNSSWYLGAIVAAWVSFGVKNLHHHWNWRIPTILQCLFAAAQICLVPFFVPESPRWLVSRDRIEEARDILNKFHGGYYPGSEMLVDYEMTEIQLAIEQERAVSSKSSYKDFIKTKANMKRLWILSWVAIFMQLSGNGLVSYYLGKVLNSIGYTSTSQQLIINACLMIFNYGVCIIQSFCIIPYIKRRWAFNGSLFGMLFCYVIWTVLSAINQQRNFEDKGLGKGVLAMIFLYYFFYNLGLNGVPFTYITEILPFTMRAKGMGLFVGIQFIVQVYNGFVNSIAMDAIEWKYYIVYCCILAVECAVCYFTFIETSGRTLEEVAEVFGDGIEDLAKVSGITALEDGKVKPDVEHKEYTTTSN
ncbi:Lactose permease [Hanseniaspora osmophila]|uniref:Lactose permease n=1 Tax=Hanseniaspora osmophila TaxID=56408 RepID=A0A1E5RBV7_9ASCO|nr:Lactose permease [Hanseniaspora osmophila]